MNIIFAIIFGLKRAPECIKTHHFEGEHAKISLGRGTTPLPRLHLHWVGDTPSPDHPLRHWTPPLDHISRYGP